MSIYQPEDNSLVLKSQAIIRGIDFSPVPEALTFFAYTKNRQGKRIRVNPKAIDWWNNSVRHERIHQGYNCEFCTSLKAFARSRAVTREELNEIQN